MHVVSRKLIWKFTFALLIFSHLIWVFQVYLVRKMKEATSLAYHVVTLKGLCSRVVKGGSLVYVFACFNRGFIVL